MIGKLNIFNLLGTVALAALCVFQWQANRNLNIQLNASEKVKLGLSADLTATQKEIKGVKADLESFRQQISQTTASLKDSEGALTTNRFKLEAALAINEQLKGSLTNWMEAVSARDAQLKTVNEKLVQLAADRNSAVQKFNQLAETHHKLAKDIEQRAKDYNVLVEKYNSLASERK